MRCPYCTHSETKVVDSRPTEESISIKRRRECEKCQRRFTTYEVLESRPVVVIKKDGRRESFDRDKIFRGIVKSCEKRSVSTEQMQKIVNDIDFTLHNRLQSEISSKEVGELVMEHLKNTDEVAYVRFASVYREFKDVSIFIEELKKFVESKNK